MDCPSVIFFTGASGAGKTSIIESLAHQFKNDDGVESLHFDSIGVPTLEVMIEEYGSGKEWQKQKTYEWIDRIIHEYLSKKLVLFEGQTEIKFIVEAFQKYNFTKYKVILVHAHMDDRHKRLSTLRSQPELVNPEMDNWADFLMRQALEFNVSVLDTSLHDLEFIVDSLSEWFMLQNFLDKKPPLCLVEPKIYMENIPAI